VYENAFWKYEGTVLGRSSDKLSGMVSTEAECQKENWECSFQQCMKSKLNGLMDLLIPIRASVRNGM
jgi:hypothetical protein